MAIRLLFLAAVVSLAPPAFAQTQVHSLVGSEGGDSYFLDVTVDPTVQTIISLTVQAYSARGEIATISSFVERPIEAKYFRAANLYAALFSLKNPRAWKGATALEIRVGLDGKTAELVLSDGFGVVKRTTMAYLSGGENKLVAPKTQAKSLPSQGKAPPKTEKPGTPMQRWKIGLERAQRSDILILATIFDPKGDAALTEFAVKQTFADTAKGPKDLNLSTDAVAKFRIETAPHPKTGKDERAYVIELKPDMYGGAEITDADILNASAVYLFDDGNVELRDSNGLRVKRRTTNKTEMIDHKKFKRLDRVPVRNEVFEQNTVNPVPLADYFKPKGIELPQATADKWGVYGWYDTDMARGSFYSSAITTQDDLELKGRLKGKEAKVWKLLQQTDKPTIAEFLKFIGKPPKAGEENPFEEYGSFNSVSRDIERAIPRLIAQFEKAYPNAIWYGLGRDIYLLNDILDAYYTYRGEPGRVRRLGASAPSFNDRNVQEVIDFLKSNGFDFENMGPDSRPQVFFDITSYSHSEARYSQSSQLMRAAWTEWARLGRDPKQLLEKVNFISTGYPGAALKEIGVNFNLKDFIEKTKIAADGPERILYAENSSSLQYSSAWHYVYGRFTKDKNGNTYAPPGDPESYTTKLKLLWELWETVQTVMNDKFTKSVDRQMEVYGLGCERKLGGN